MRPVSVVIPAFRARADLTANLPALLDELGRRAVGDEVIVVDDAGDDDLSAWVAATFPPPETFDRAGADVRVLRRKKNAGAARAALDGAKAAGHELVLLLSPKVRVRSGFLAPLAAAFDDAAVAAASPRLVTPDGRGLARLVWRHGLLEIEPGEPAPPDASGREPADAAWAPLHALLARRDELVAAGFDARFAPGDLADVDLSWTWKRAGRRVVQVPAAEVELASAADARRPDARAAELRVLELRNRLLLTWKHLDAPERRAEHQDALEAFALEALLAGRREDLAALALALEADAGR
jgi:GT2 family glycosyltransferase